MTHIIPVAELKPGDVLDGTGAVVLENRAVANGLARWLRVRFPNAYCQCVTADARQPVVIRN